MAPTLNIYSTVLSNCEYSFSHKGQEPQFLADKARGLELYRLAWRHVLLQPLWLLLPAQVSSSCAPANRLCGTVRHTPPLSLASFPDLRCAAKTLARRESSLQLCGGCVN